MTSNVNNHRKQVKLKASIEELVGSTLDRISDAKGPNERIVKELIENTKGFLESRERYDIELMKICGDIERQIECCQKNKGVHNKSTSSTKDEILQPNSSIEEEKAEHTLTVLMENLNKILKKSGGNPSIVPPKTKTDKVGGPSKTSDHVDDDAKNELEECRNELRPQERFWLDSLGIFPLYTKLSKRLLVHWWIGLDQVPLEGNVNRTSLQLVKQSISKKLLQAYQRWNLVVSAVRTALTNYRKEGEQIDTTSEQLVEEFFDYLVQKDIFEPIHREHNQVINQCTINPTIHRRLRATFWWDQLRLRYKAKTLLNARAPREDASCHFLYDNRYNARALLNVDQKYLNSKNIASKNVLGIKNALNVIHLGRWYFTDLENDNTAEEVVSFGSQDHIEVDGTDFLKELGENVIFLSLRGISMIDELPESIGKLKYLRILDLRACHNLAKLPQKPQSKVHMFKSHWFNNLTNLDISECYMLNHIPIWICELSNLEVFKGYVAGSEDKKGQLCRLRDLSKLKKLRKLSIRIVKPLDPEDAKGLESMNRLSILTISWSINKLDNDEDVDWTILFPKKLEKLDLRCYPEADAAKLLNPELLQELKRLYIRGGNIAKIANDSFWTVKIVRLRFLDFLEIEWYELNRIFPKLKHVEYKRCPKLKDFPNRRWNVEKDGGSWNAEKDGPFPKCHGVDSTRVEMKITSNKVVPLGRNNQKIMLEVTGGDSIADGPGLTLVTVLDVSKSMDENDDNKIENLKLAMLFMINKLRSVDRLAIVTFSDEARTLWPLQKVTETSRRKLGNLVKKLAAGEERDTNIIDGLRMGLDILKDHQISTQDHIALIFVSCTDKYLPIFNPYTDIPNNVVVHTFGLGSRHDGKTFWSTASARRGGTYSEVRNSENLIKAVAVCLAGLLTVVVQDLTLTLKPIKDSSIEKVFAGSYSRVAHYDIDVGSVTVKFGDLYRGEVRKVLVDLSHDSALEEGETEVLKVYHSYKLSGNLFMPSPVVFSQRRSRTVSVDQLQALPEVLAEETRAKIAKDMDRRTIWPDIYNEEKYRELSLEYKKLNLHETNELLESLSVLDELSKRGVSRSSRNLINKFAHSFEISHNNQRAAARGDDMEKWLTFATPAMLSFLREAKEFSADPSMSSTPVTQ